MPESFELIEKFATSLQGQGKSPSTVHSYSRDIKNYFHFLNDAQLSLEDVDQDQMLAFVTWISEKDRHNSVRRNIIGVRQFYRFLASEEPNGDSPFDHLPIPERDESLPEELVIEDIEALESVALSQPSKVKQSRDRAILFLLAFEGVKSNEIISIRHEDLLISSTTASIQIQGNKKRSLSIGVESAQALRQYLSDLPQSEVIREIDIQALFISFKGRNLSPNPIAMSRHGLKFLIYELGEAAGIPSLHSELLRHFAIKHQIGLGKTPQEIMSHFGLKRLGNIAKHINKSKSST